MSDNAIFVMPEEIHLYSTRRGVSLLCACCARIEVTLGNAVLVLDAEGVDSVLQLIETFAVDSAPDHPPPRRDFLIRTEHGDAAFAFSKDEVMELRDLLTHARAAVMRRRGESPARPTVRPCPALLHTLN